MSAVEIIRRKRDGGVLDAAAIDAFVSGATDGSWPDYQCAAMLMAILLKGMDLDEAAALTDAMVRSGLRVDVRKPSNGTLVVDKHSTGGVGDKTSLILAPLAAACGLIVPMMSGRGLGHTGGTLDKLESIPGFSTRLSLEAMHRGLERRGCVMIGQTDDIAPADKRLYALRDVTGTVESIPLLCSSILCKKIAEGIGALVMDVKVGHGAFMKTDEGARELATWLVGIAERNGVRTEALITAMDAPLGRHVGNASEVIESIETLKGRGPKDLEDLSVRLTTRMLVLAGHTNDERDAEARVRGALSSGAGLEAFRGIIEEQGGNPRVLDDYALLPVATTVADIPAPHAGFINEIKAEHVGRAAVHLGAGRARVDSVIDAGVSIELVAVVGDRVAAGDPVLRVRYNNADNWPHARTLLRESLVVTDVAPAVRPLVREVIGGRR